MYHGRSCRKRSFPTKCKTCGAKLLYWECEHGCKVFLEFDQYGRMLGKHKCKTIVDPSKSKKKRSYFNYDGNFDLTTVSKTFIEKLFKEAYTCPVCKLDFSTEGQYYQHLKQKKEFDNAHADFYRENRQVIDGFDDDENEGEDKNEEGNDDNYQNDANQNSKSIKPERTKAYATDDGGINYFGRIRFKNKQGKSKRVKSHEDWWEDFKEE